MKFLGYIDDVLTLLFRWQFSHWWIAIPMLLIELFIILKIIKVVRCAWIDEVYW